jgi:hypothetical protein
MSISSVRIFNTYFLDFIEVRNAVKSDAYVIIIPPTHTRCINDVFAEFYPWFVDLLQFS